MESFATVTDYQARYGVVSDLNLLQECLNDTTMVIKKALDKAGVDYSNPDDDLAYALMSVCRSAANRIMPSDGGAEIMPGATSMSATAGPYSQQISFSGAYGTAKLLPSELELLGIGGATGRMINANNWGTRNV